MSTIFSIYYALTQIKPSCFRCVKVSGKDSGLGRTHPNPATQKLGTTLTDRYLTPLINNSSGISAMRK
jgi:hypothetical protein